MRGAVSRVASVSLLFALMAMSASAETPANLFGQNCAACHQPQGQGVPGAFPALAGDPVVKGDPRAAAWIVIHGRGGMPNFSADLSDADIAAVLTYVRSSFGNHAPPVLPATVAAVRTGGPSAKDPSAAVMPYH